MRAGSLVRRVARSLSVGLMLLGERELDERRGLARYSLGRGLGERRKR
eukprot:COSAG02_NODE_18039_length_964_cov_3.246243_3_plen_47_part_01